MAVLNGERMHDTMERLLPGARSAALPRPQSRP